MLIALSLCVKAFGGTIANGDFENSHEGQPVGWQVLGSGACVKPFTSAVWHHAEMVFNSGEYGRIRLWLGIQAGSGTIWYDNVDIRESEFSVQNIVNRSFEKGDGKSISGWVQDPGDGSVRDTTRWVRFPGQEGNGASARVTSLNGKKSLIGQDIQILGRWATNREFVLSFDWRTEEAKRQPFAEVYGLDDSGGVGRLLRTTPLARPFPQKDFGEGILSLSLSSPGESGVSQQFELSGKEQKLPCCVKAMVRVERLNQGALVLSVQPGADSASEVHAKVTNADDSWEELSQNFIPGTVAPQIAVYVKGSQASAYVDNVVVGPAEITPRPKRLEWLLANQSFPIPEKLAVGVEGDGGVVVASAVRLFSESLKERTGSMVEYDNSPQANKPDIELVVSSQYQTQGHSESYSLQVNRDGVRIESSEGRGILDGLMTLIKLVQRAPGGGSLFLAAKIEDYPDLPFRGEYWAGDGPGLDYKKLMDRLARLRYNAVTIENYPYFSLDNPESRRQTEAIFNYARSLGIEPIPDLESFGHAYEVNMDPNIAEGTEVDDEKLMLVGTDPVALAHPNVIRTMTAPIRITDESGKQVYLEGPDYTIIPGGMGWKDKNGFSSKAAPFKVERSLHSRIPDGATVLASYDYVSMTDDGTQPSYCPNEPRVYRIMGDAIRNTIQYLHPQYLNIGHDEIMQMGTDSRCRKSGRSNAENFAYEVWRLYRIAKAADPNIKLMMWDDMINPYTHGYFSNSCGYFN